MIGLTVDIPSFFFELASLLTVKVMAVEGAYCQLLAVMIRPGQARKPAMFFVSNVSIYSNKFIYTC